MEMSEMNWPQREAHAREQLTRSELKLLAYVNTNPEKAALLSQKELTAAAGISKPVLISFFRKLGFDNYRGFQDGVEQFFSSHIDSFRASEAVHARVTSLTEMIEQAFSVDIRTLERVRSNLSEATLARFGEHIREGKSVYVAGLGTGNYPAHYLAQRLRRYRCISVLLSQDETHQIDELYPLEKGDMVVLFLYSREDNWIFPILRFVRERGATSMLVAATIHPDYVTASDHFVHVPRGEVGFKNSMSAPMAYANILLLAAEVVPGSAAREHLKGLEITRNSWVKEYRQGGNYA